MGDVVDHIDAGHALLLEQEHGLTFLLAEDRDQDISAGHFTLAGALHMEDSTLQNALEAQSRLGFAIFIVLRNQWRGGVDKLLQIVAQLVEVGPTGPQHTGSCLVIQQGEQ